MGCLLDQEQACIEVPHRQDLRGTADQGRAGMTGTGIATETGIGIETETFVTGIEIVSEMSEIETGTVTAIETETEIVEEIGSRGDGVVLPVEEVVADDTFRKGSLSTTIAWIFLPFSSYSYILGCPSAFCFDNFIIVLLSCSVYRLFLCIVSLLPKLFNDCILTYSPLFFNLMAMASTQRNLWHGFCFLCVMDEEQKNCGHTSVVQCHYSVCALCFDLLRTVRRGHEAFRATCFTFSRTSCRSSNQTETKVQKPITETKAMGISARRTGANGLNASTMSIVPAICNIREKYPAPTVP